MTLRDLTKRQLYNLRRRCDKEHRAYEKLLPDEQPQKRHWDKAFSLGVKAALELKSSCPTSSLTT